MKNKVWLLLLCYIANRKTCMYISYFDILTFYFNGKKTHKDFQQISAHFKKLCHSPVMCYPYPILLFLGVIFKLLQIDLVSINIYAH